MTQPRNNKADRFAEALGASRVVSVEGVSPQGPLGLLWLRAAVARDVRREEHLGARAAAEQVRVADSEQWRELERLAVELSSPGRALDPLDLAAHLIEHKLLEVRHLEGPKGGAGRDALRPPSPVRLDSFYEGLASPADCFESMEVA
jgi:hypothetical protein